MRTREATICLEKAHDVRCLRTCERCGKIGDKRYMPLVSGKLVHGFCALDMVGIAGLARLPKAEYGKITLSEIGPKAMKALLDRIA